MPYFRQLFPPHLSGALVALYSHTLIKRLSFGLLGIFEAIFLFESFNRRLIPVLAYFAVIYGLYLLLVPLGAQLVSEIGYRRSMRAGLAFTVAYMVLLASVAGGWLPAATLWSAAIAVAMYKTLYWLPYHVEFARFTSRVARGRYVGLLDSTALLLGIALPIAAAFIITHFGYPSLIVVALLVLLISIVPLAFLPDVRENYSFSYRQTFKQLWSPRWRRELLAYAADGVQDVAGAIIWPIFIFLLLQGKYLEVGYVSSFIILATTFVRLVVGEWTDEYGPKLLLRWGTLLSSIAWLVRVFIETATQVFLVGVFHNMAESTTKTSWNTLLYERAADQGHLVDEYTVLREMALNVGRLFALALVLVFLPFVPLTVTFVLAAVAVLLLNLLR